MPFRLNQVINTIRSTREFSTQTLNIYSTEPEIVTETHPGEEPIVTEEEKTPPDDSSDNKTEVTKIEPAAEVVAAGPVAPEPDAAETTQAEPIVSQKASEGTTEVIELANENNQTISNESSEESPVEAGVKETNEVNEVNDKDDASENPISQDVSQPPEIITSSTTSPKPKKNQISPMSVSDKNKSASNEAVDDSKNIENVPIMSPKPKKNQIQPLEILDSNQDRPTSAKSLRNFTNQELFSIGSRANTNISETAIDNWTKVGSRIIGL